MVIIYLDCMKISNENFRPLIPLNEGDNILSPAGRGWRGWTVIAKIEF